MSANIEHENDNIYLLRISGSLTKAELDAVQSDFAERIASAGPVRLLVLLQGFTGWERSQEWDDTEFFFNHRDDFEKIAVNGPARWEAEVLAFTGAGLRKGPVKFFSNEDASEARAWLAE